MQFAKTEMNFRLLNVTLHLFDIASKALYHSKTEKRKFIMMIYKIYLQCIKEVNFFYRQIFCKPHMP